MCSEENRSGNKDVHGRETYVAQRATMLEFATSILVNFKSFLMVTSNNGGKAYHDPVICQSGEGGPRKVERAHRKRS